MTNCVRGLDNLKKGNYSRYNQNWTFIPKLSQTLLQPRNNCIALILFLLPIFYFHVPLQLLFPAKKTKTSPSPKIPKKFNNIMARAEVPQQLKSASLHLAVLQLSLFPAPAQGHLPVLCIPSADTGKSCQDNFLAERTSTKSEQYLVHPGLVNYRIKWVPGPAQASQVKESI